MLRSINYEGDNLFLVKEPHPKKFEINGYKNGLIKLKQGFSHKFGSEVKFSFPIRNIEDLVFQHLFDQSKLKIDKNVDEMVENMLTDYMTSDINTDFDTYLKLNQNSQVMSEKDLIRSDSYRPSFETPKIIGLIKSYPEKFSIKKNNFLYQEVALSNKFSTIFYDYNEFLDYQFHNREPSAIKYGGIRKPDLIVNDGDYHVIEIKEQLGYRLNHVLSRKHRKSFSQMLMTSKFIHGNFIEKFKHHLIGINRNTGSIFQRIRIFDAEQDDLIHYKDNIISDSYIDTYRKNCESCFKNVA